MPGIKPQNLSTIKSGREVYMRTTGIVRRIDDLGRIVIPKEIRKNFRINNGDNIEIFMDEDNIVLKKYSLLNKIGNYADKFTEVIYSFLKHNIIITDTDNIIAFSGPLKKEYINKPISEYLTNCISRRENIHEKYIKEINLIDGRKENATYCLSTVISGGDVAGLVIILSTETQVTEVEMKICQIVSKFLAKSLEE